MAYRVKVHYVAEPNRAKQLLSAHGCDPYGVEAMAPKFCHYVLELSGLQLRGALILKQEMLSVGGEAALPREAAALTVPKVNILLAGTYKQYATVLGKLKMQPFGLRQAAAEIEEALENIAIKHRRWWRCGRFELELGRQTLIMGILNVTPDSFSDGGMFFDPEAAVQRGKELVAIGADILDLGGESTRPGASPVSGADELGRLLPVVSQLAAELSVPISIDTTKYEVAEACLDAGAAIINDVSGLADSKLAALAARFGSGLVVMHTQGGPQHMQDNPVYTDVVREVVDLLRQSTDDAVDNGVTREQIVIDPGIGFGKNREHNLELLHRLDELAVLGYPILLGTSRKSVIGEVLDLPAQERAEGTGATVALGVQAGVDVVRVHDVREMSRVAKMADAVVRFSTAAREGC